MPRYLVTWSVDELVNGPGHPEDGKKHLGIAKGRIEKDGEEADLRRELTQLLQRSWPPTALGDTYNLERIYNIDIQKV